MTSETQTAELWRVEWDSAQDGGWTVYRRDEAGEIVRDSNHARKVIAQARAAELNLYGDDEQRRGEEGDDQRDFAEERANARLMTEEHSSRRADLVDELEQQDRENVTTAARDTLAAIEELEQLRRLADLLPRFLLPQANHSRLRAERMAGRPGVPAHKLEHARQEAAELAEALEIARRWSPLRRSILAKALPNAGGIPGDGWDASSISD